MKLASLSIMLNVDDKEGVAEKGCVLFQSHRERQVSAHTV